MAKAIADSCCAIGFLSGDYYSDGMIGAFGMVAGYLGTQMN